jgi:hypothetical protein
MLQLDGLLLCEVLDPQSQHRLAVCLRCAHICYSSFLVAKENGILLKNIVLAFVTILFTKFQAFLMLASKLVVCVLERLLRKELLNLKRLVALLAI